MREVIEFPSNGHVATGYLAVPSSGPGPGVVVIQEWWGLVPHIKSVCDRLADGGFTALAPDLYHGTSTFEPSEAKKQMMELKIDEAARDLHGAVSHLLDNRDAVGPRVGVVGFCLGGGLAIHLASREAEVAACVAYYGVGPARDQLDTSQMRAAVLGHWGEQDHSYDHETIDGLEKRLGDAGIAVEFCWYDADHAFFNDQRPTQYKPEAAQLSWERTLAFFHQHLRRDR